jgi:hypothetical protein
MTLKIWLIVTGILSAITLAMPSIVVIGMFLMLVPGLIMMAAPTIFMYLATFAVVRMILPMPPGIAPNAVAAISTLFLGWAVVQPSVWIGKRAFDRVNLPDVTPATPVALAGHIRLVTPDVETSRDAPKTMTCNALCAAVLATPGVTAVTLVSARTDKPFDPVTFRLIPKGTAREQGLTPVKPEAILEHLPPTETPTGRRDFDAEIKERTRLKQAAAADWAVRLASRETLIAEPARAKADMSILIDAEPFTGARGKLQRVEIRDAADRAVMRKSVLRVSTLAAPLYVGGEGGIENFRIVWGRSTMRTGPDYPELKSITELFLHSTLARPARDFNTANELRQRLAMALDDADRPATDADFALANVWFSTTDWSKPLSESDVTLLGRAIADPRISITRQLYDGYERQIAVALRPAIGARIVNPATVEEERRRLAQLLTSMPEGTFATLTADERHFLGNGKLRAQTTPMLARLADRGAAAVPDLLAILDSDHRIEPWAKRWQALESLCLAFVRLGPDAKAALPVVDELVNRERSPLLNTREDRSNWNLALVRMGKSPENIDFPNSTPETSARDREWLRQRAAKFDPAKDRL